MDTASKNKTAIHEFFVQFLEQKEQEAIRPRVPSKSRKSRSFPDRGTERQHDAGSGNDRGFVCFSYYLLDRSVFRFD